MNYFILLCCLLPQLLFATGYQPSLIGGTPVQPGEFPEVVYIRSGNSRCSATVIGPRVIMTAGHCVKDGSSINQVDFVVGQIVFNAKCEQAPLYRDGEGDHDMALCLVDKDIDLKFASVGLKKVPKIGDLVQLSGYGCIKEGGGGGNDGILRTGQAKVTQLPKGTDYWFYSLGNSALCFGDSGGPAFAKIDNAAKEHHYVIGVNSRGNIKDLSLLTALWTDKSVEFFKDFETKHSVKICGISKVCDSSTKPDPEPKPDPDPDSAECGRFKDLSKIYMLKYKQCIKQSTMEFFEE